MANCCTSCFKDQVLNEFIEKNGSTGNCDCCGENNIMTINASELEDKFIPLISLYTPYRRIHVK